MNLRGADSLDGREIKRVEGLHFREARLVEALPDHRLMARGQLCGQDLVQIVFVRPVRVAGLPGEAIKRPRDARELQRARVGAHEIVGEGGGAHTASASQPS